MMEKSNRGLMTVCLFLGMMFVSSLLAMHAPLLSSIIGHYSLVSSAQGFSSSAASIGSVAALVSSFFLIGRLNKLRMLGLSILSSALFLALLSIAPDYWIFVGIWLGLGLSVGYMDMLLAACMADLYEGSAGTRMMCVLYMLGSVSFVAAPVLYARLLAGGMFWARVYLCASAAGLLVALVFFASIRSGRGYQRRAPENRLTFKDMPSLLRQGALIALIASTLCYGAYLGGINTWINRYIGVTLDSPLGDIALSSLSLGVLCSRLVMSFSPVQPKIFVRWAGILSGIILLAAIPFHNGLIMCIACALCGFVSGATLPCLLGIACAETPRSTTFTTTAMMLALYVGQAVSAPLVGALETAFTLDAGIALCAAFVAASSLCCFRKSLRAS